jgi:hypothetical protein
LPNPILQPLHGLIVALRDFGFDWSKVVFGWIGSVYAADESDNYYQQQKSFIHIKNPLTEPNLPASQLSPQRR